MHLAPSSTATITLAAILLVGCTGSDGADGEVPAAMVADVVDDTATSRCDRLGYPCSFSDTEPDVFEHVVDLTDRVQAAIDDAADPRQGIIAAAELLRGEERVVEIIPDDTLFASIMFRVDGAPPAVAFTELAAPVGEAPAVTEETPDETEEQAAGLVAASFRPAGGPINPKRALVLDPYASPGEGCATEAGDDCWITPKGRSEGAAVQAIMAAHPQVEVTYVNQQSTLDMAGLVDALATYDLIHIATHGSSNCNSSTVSWFTDIDETTYVDRDDKQALAENLGGIQNQEWKPDECYSVAAIAPLNLPDHSTYESQQSRLPPDLPDGLAFNDSHWLATTDFWVGRVSDDAIAYFSHCTSGDGQFARSGDFGAFVGWHSYASLGTAQEAAISFWDDMVTEGAEFELAKENLSEQGLDWSFQPNIGFRDYRPRASASLAAMVAAGQNLRARDVITTYVDDAELTDGATVRAEGVVADGEHDTIESVRFLVEGVRNGAEDDTRVEVRLDGEVLGREITVGRDGEPTDVGDLWTDWEVTVEDLELERDLTAGDTSPDDPEDHTWEARVFTNQAFHSAHEADPVHFAATVRARGKLTAMEEAVASMPFAELPQNELVLEFPSDGGEVEGTYAGEIVTDRDAVGITMEVVFRGTYDAEQGQISGTVDSVNQVRSPSPLLNATHVDFASFEGTVDHGDGRVDLRIMGSGPPLSETLRYE